uniref:t-SNARE coiled-coil homology domain-containing protein n=1 Tax=Araucaria cunninghamii TaxID=56994 RepID=A0A0D6R0A8_ARACU
MNDLLSRSFSRGEDNSFEFGGDLEMGETDKNLAPFFSEVGVMKAEMEQMKQLLLQLSEANEDSKTIHKAEAMKALRARMDHDVEQVLKKSKVIKGKLEQLDKANVASRRIPGCEEGSSTDRTRMATTNGVRISLRNLMGEFQRLRQAIMVEYKETVERRYYTVTGQKADEETIERIIETGESENMLQKAIQEQGRGQVIEVIKEIQERHDAVKDIERNLLELHQLFLDMSVLVQEQGGQLNDIEAHVTRASSFVQTGTRKLGEARRLQKNTRKWTCIAIIILLIIILIIVLPLVLKK